MSELSLTPIYRFSWENHASRQTDDPDAFEEAPHPDAIEALAAFGREDPDCEVTLLGMGT